MDNEILLIERKGYVCTLVLNRPEKRNSLSPDLLIEIHQTLQEFSKDDTIRTIIIRGAGDRAFSSGYDIGAIPTKITPEIQGRLKAQNPLELALESVANYPYPVIAMLNGYAFGAGCELAVSCDIRIGADDIRMGMPPAKLGVVYFSGRLATVHPGHWAIRDQGTVFHRPLLRHLADQRDGTGGLSYSQVRARILYLRPCRGDRFSNAPLSLRGTKGL